jgi:hypothetical protein
MGVVSLMAVSVTKFGLSGQKAVQSADESSRLTAEMANIVANPNACLHTFAGRTPATGATVSSIRNVTNAAVFQTATVYGNRTVRLMAVEVGGPGTDSRTQLPRYNATTPTAGTALVKVTWRKMADAAGPLDLHRFYFLNVTLNAAGEITACSAQSNLAEEIWQRSGADPTTIYYNGGNVGIGTLAPKTKLQIDGAIKIGSEEECDEDREGALRYKKDGKILQLCDGEDWVAVGGGDQLEWF